MRKVLNGITALAMSLSLVIGNVAFAESDIKVTLNGTQIQFDQPPIIQNERTLVPIRAIFEAMGMSVSWNEDTRNILAVGDNGVITMQIGTMSIGYGSSQDNIELHPMDVAPCIINERTLVPVRFIAEATGYNVNWDDNSKTVVITGEQKNSAAKYEVKGSLDFYDGTNVVDYGKLNNTECLEEGTDENSNKYYKYNTPNTDVANYIYALEAHGYSEKGDSTSIFGLLLFNYSDGNTTANFSYDKSSGKLTLTIK